jgi:hypothetical protein
MNSTPPIPASQHGMVMTLPPGALGPDGYLRSSEAGLPVGTRLGEFEITGLIGEGGFGIVYMATDHLLGRQVALKEYMPSALASRSAQAQVGVKSDRHADTFEAGRRSFVNEARLLAQFDHPALVKVFRFWEANGTAYMAMPYYRGRTLRQALAEMAAPPSQQWLQHILLPLIDALATLHAAQCYHRDIAPDNILLLDNGQPVLLDFGAARRVIGDITQALTVILKPGFAPVEQYANGPEMKQGPWTDVYALAAVVYYCATLKTPVPAVSRMMKDTLEPFSTLARDRYDPDFCEAVDRGLAVAVEERIQSMSEFREALGLDAGAGGSGKSAIGGASATGGRGGAGSTRGGTTIAGFGGSGDLDATIVDPTALQRARSGDPGRLPDLPPSRGVAENTMHDSARASQPAKAEKPWTPNADVQMERLAAGAPPSANRRNAGPWLPVGAFAMLLAIGAGGFWYWEQSAERAERIAQAPGTASPGSPAGGPDTSPSPGTTPQPATPGTAASPPPPAPAPPVATAPSTGAAPSAPTPSPSAPSPLSAAPSPAVPSPAPPMVPSLVPQPGPAPDAGTPGPTAHIDNAPLPVGRIIDDLHQQRDPAWPVSVRLASDRVKIGKDRLSFRLRSERDGYVYLLMQGTDRSHFYQLFPNGIDKNNRLRGNTDMSLPRSNWEMVAGGPAGLNRFIALVTPSPRNFASAGLGSAQPFGEFDPQVAGKVFADRGAAPFAGEPAGCSLGDQACASYGAVLFEIEEY